MSLRVTKLEEILQELTGEDLQPGLYVVATDIGHPGDITLRALSVLNGVDLVICEERRAGTSVLKRYGISKPVELLNEHNEKTQTKNLLERFFSGKLRAALITDSGTPLFADPGSKLVEQCHHYRIPVIPIPGPSSLMAALMSAGRESQEFTFYGFLPANKEERISELRRLKMFSANDLVFLEAPYRLEAFLRDMQMVLGKGRRGVISYKLTQPEERIFTGDLQELQARTRDLPKGEFVFILLAEEKKR